MKDLDRAVAFYRDALGMRPLFQVPKMAFFDCGGIPLMLSLPETPEFEGEPHVVARLPAHTLWMAFCRDPEGNVLALMSEVQSS